MFVPSESYILLRLASKFLLIGRPILDVRELEPPFLYYSEEIKGVSPSLSIYKGTSAVPSALK